MLTDRDRKAWKKYLDGRVEMKKYDPDYDSKYMVRIVERLAKLGGHSIMFQYISNSVNDFNTVGRLHEALQDDNLSRLRYSLREKIRVMENTEEYDYSGELDARIMAQMSLLSQQRPVDDEAERYMSATNDRMSEPGYYREWCENWESVVDYKHMYARMFDVFE